MMPWIKFMTNQNISSAVMQQRGTNKTELDFFPTPAWATRALCTHILNNQSLSILNCLEPACGQGHMSKPLGEFFKDVSSFDIHSYGYGETINFLDYHANDAKFDWIITNPPFNLAQDFIIKSIDIAEIGVAVLVRTNFLETIGRYNNLFTVYPPSIVAQFSERVPMIKGRVDRKASTATGYCWIIWQKGKFCETELKWIPPCRRILEKDEDYE